MAKSAYRDEKIGEKLQNLYSIAEHNSWSGISCSDVLYKHL